MYNSSRGREVLRLNGIKSLTVEARSNVLQAAGYTTRRYVKLLPRFVEPLFSVCPARSSRRQEGVLLQGHPRPWPVAKPRTLWVPAHKVQFRIGVVWCEGCIPLGRSVLREYPATSTHSRFGQRGPGRAVPSLSSLPCWVVPPPKTRQSAEPPAPSSSSVLQGKPPRGVGLFIHGCYSSSLCKLSPGAPLAEASGHPWCGPFRPGPWRPSAFRTGRRSLAASGSLRSPVRGPAKAQRPQAYAARPPPRPYPPLRFGALLV